MNTAVLITLIIVGGVVLISLAGIGLAAWLAKRGLASFSSRQARGHEAREMESLEKEVQELRRDVDDLKRRMSS